jgi:hypothetical protein
MATLADLPNIVQVHRFGLVTKPSSCSARIRFAVHPGAALFPMLADDELEELAADIKERGLLQPIVLDAEGRVLDGRNRLAACEKAGIKPAFVTYADGDSDGYALAVNISRRHLKASAQHLITEMARRLAGGGQFAKMQTAEVGAKAGDVDAFPRPALSSTMRRTL